MYFVMYDRQFNTIEGTYIVESWNLIRRSYDFDDIKITGEIIPPDAEPFFIVVNDKRGHEMFSGLANIPEIDGAARKSAITLKDYMTLFNSDIIVDWSTVPGATLKEFFTFVFGIWKTQNGAVGIDNVFIDADEIDFPLDASLPFGTDIESISTYDVITDNMYYYGVWCEPVLSVQNKSLTFIFRKVGTVQIDVRLKDFGISRIEKAFGAYNQVSIWQKGASTPLESWSLTADNNVVKLPSGKAVVYPVKNRNTLLESDAAAADVNEARRAAVLELAGNRYQENFDLDVAKSRVSQELMNINFSTSVNVYTPLGLYKTLPVGEIETDDKGTYIVRIGRRPQELTQEL
jgi:hypothetical protein